MSYSDKFFKKVKDGTLEVEDIIEFLDEWLADEASRREREEAKRQENKCCENCKYFDGEVCAYWGMFEEEIEDNVCGQWR